MRVKPKESFDGKLRTGYKFDFKKSNQYECEVNDGIWYVVDKHGYRVPFTKEDFDETFVIK